MVTDIVSFVILGLLMVAIAYKMVGNYEDLCGAAMNRHRISLQAIDGRGVVYDRNSRPMTGMGQGFAYVIKREKLDDTAEELLRQAGAEKRSCMNDHYHLYIGKSSDAKELSLLKRHYGVYITPIQKRYCEKQVAAHVIGYINRQNSKGIAGLEAMFDNELSKRKKTLFVPMDARGNVLNGLELQTDVENRRLGIVTTLDMELQNKVEELLKMRTVTGAAVVMECETGEVVVCASAPGFDPEKVEIYTALRDHNLINRAIQGEYPLGNIFDTVNMLLGEGTEILWLERAGKLGFGKRVPQDYPMASSGKICHERENFKATPIQVCRFVNTLACGGLDKGVILVRGMSKYENEVYQIRDMGMGGRDRAKGRIIDEDAAALALKRIEESHDEGHWRVGVCNRAGTLYAVAAYVESIGAGSTSGQLYEEIKTMVIDI